jgi:ferredoxin-NADP reductase
MSNCRRDSTSPWISRSCPQPRLHTFHSIFGRPVMWRAGTVVALRDETAMARTIILEVRDWPGHLAGQHVDVRLTAADGYSAVRSYSIASAPEFEGHFQITVERLPNGEVSPYLTQQVAVADRLEIRGPVGGWFVWRSQQTGPVQLVAGGSGIVPLVAMIRSRASVGSTVLSLIVAKQESCDHSRLGELPGAPFLFPEHWSLQRVTTHGFSTPHARRQASPPCAALPWRKSAVWRRWCSVAPL